MGELVEVFVESVRVHMGSGQHVIILQSSTGQTLPIWTGAFEANSIAIAITESETDRPITHHFIADMITKCGLTLDRIIVHAVKDDVYFADVILHHGDEEFRIDARPSDGIAIALRLSSPIFVASELMSSQGEGMPPKLLEEDTSLQVFKDMMDGSKNLPDEPSN